MAPQTSRSTPDTSLRVNSLRLFEEEDVDEEDRPEDARLPYRIDALRKFRAEAGGIGEELRAEAAPQLDNLADL